MAQMTVEKPTDAQLTTLGVKDWPTWSKEVSTFPWHYDAKETAYVLEGEVTVTADNGDQISFSAGDLVTFEKGLSCTWEVKQALKKHYHFE